MLRRTIFGRALFVGVGLLWAGLVLFGARMLLNYESAPGAPGTAPSQWPSNSGITRPDSKFALVMLAHPNCPCTRASLAELEILMAQLRGKLVAFVVFGKPDASAAEIHRSDLWKKAATIPDTFVLYDGRGEETEKFAGQVSGQTMLYEPGGRLVFSGGITRARGHQGDNAGVDAVILAVSRDAKTLVHTPAFGCALHDPSAQELKEGSPWKKQ
jgi:hypothetical protein